MNTFPLKRRTLLMSSLLMGAGVQAQAQSGNWPERPIKLVVAGSAGAGGDIFARLIGTPLQAVLKQPVVVDPKPGANGLIACDAVAKAAGDGYTFLLAPSSAILINPIIHDKMPYNTERDLVPVVQVGAAGILLVAIVAAIATASSCTRSSGTTRLTRPMTRASSARCARVKQPRRPVRPAPPGRSAPRRDRCGEIGVHPPRSQVVRSGG